MTEKAKKCDVNKVMHIVKQEFEHADYMDDEVPVFEAVNITKSEVDDYLMEENAIPTLDVIKTELTFEGNNMISNNFKLKDEIDSVDVKIESNNEVLFCNNCNEDYQDYCTKCAMLVHILNKTVISNTDQRVRDEIPQDILDFRSLLGRIGIFALKVIPENVVLGPFTGVGSSQRSWKIKAGKFIVTDDNSKFLSWMWYVNHSRDLSGQNLVPFQREGRVYYRSISTIQEGDELLVYFGVEYEDSLNNDVEMDFFPIVETQVENVFACTFCCLGFRSAAYLAKHKIIGCNRSTGNFSIQELVQCSFCKIYLDEKEYLDYHMNYCCARDDRVCSSMSLDHQMVEAKRGKTQRCQMYKCSKCKYKTIYKGDLKSHANQHYEVKTFRCAVCSRRFKTKESLRLHMENVHGDIEGTQAQKRCKINSVGAEHQEASENLYEMDEEQQFKCPDFKTDFIVRLNNRLKVKNIREYNYNCTLCEFKANRRWAIERHTKSKHLKEFNYKCQICGYETNDKSKLNSHTKTKHLEEFSYKCEMCDYKTNRKTDLGIHTKTRHLKEFNYKCTVCEFRTNYKSGLEEHVKTKHLKQFNYACVDCEYKSNRRSDFERHIKTKHLKEFDYNCERCDYKTNDKSNLNNHMKTKHLEEFSYKCDSCEYETNNKTSMRCHVKGKHLEEFSHRCESCGYRTNRKWDLEKHMRTKHLKEFKYRCELCQYKTNRKFDLGKHTRTVHLKEYNYKCGSCEYETNDQSNLKGHVRRKHVKQLSE